MNEDCAPLSITAIRPRERTTLIIRETLAALQAPNLNLANINTSWKCTQATVFSTHLSLILILNARSKRNKPKMEVVQGSSTEKVTDLFSAIVIVTGRT